MLFAEAIAPNGFLLVAEIEPPKGTDLAAFDARAGSFKGRVDALAVTDSDHAIMRMSPLAPCHQLLSKNIDPVLILGARDRNRISLQADLLAAWALGVRQVILKEGIEPAWGDQPTVLSSGDLTLDIMVECARALNDGTDLGGHELDGRTDFIVGVGIDPSDDVTVNRRMSEKLSGYADKGVRFAILGPTYDRNIIDVFVEKAEAAGLRLIPTIVMLKSVAMIRYLNNLPGVPAVPHEFLKEMMDAPVKAEAGVEIAARFYSDIRDAAHGVLLNAMGWGSRMPAFLDKIGR